MNLDKIVITFNECFSSNLGDQAICQNLNRYLIDKGYEVSNLYLSKPQTTSLPEFNYSLNPNLDARYIPLIKRFLYIPYWYFKNKKFLDKYIRKAGIFVFGGGQLLISSKRIYPSAFAISLYFITYLIKKYKKKKIYLVGVGAVSKYGFIEKYFYRKALERADYIIVRDSNSREYIRTNFYLHVEVMPDIAFYEPTIESNNGRNALLFVTDYNKISKYSKEKYQNRNKYYEYLFEQINTFFEQNLKISLCYTTIEDANETYKFKDYLFKEKQMNIDIKNVQSLSDLENVLRNTQLINASRMHALILGKKNGCTIVAHNISDKIESFSKEFSKRKNSDLHIDLVSKLNKLF